MFEVKKDSSIKYTNTTDRDIKIVDNITLKGIKQKDGENDYDFLERKKDHIDMQLDGMQELRQNK